MLHIIPRLTRKKYIRTIMWSVGLCVAIVISAAAIGRAAHNFSAALTDKPDVAIYLLLPNAGLGKTTVIRETETERDYLAETSSGILLVKMKKGPKEWFVSETERLHE